MAIVKCKPTSPGRRHVVKVVNADLHKGKPYAPLLEKNSKNGGRNNNGRCLLYTSPSPRDRTRSRMPSSA